MGFNELCITLLGVNMSLNLLNVIMPVVQATDLPNVLKPWQENWLIDAILLGSAIFMVGGVWLWARSGRSKRENKVPFERTAEDFAGTVQASYGVIPVFLYALYTIVIISMILYVINAILSGVKY